MICATIAGDAPPDVWFCAPYDVGVLFAMNGAGTPDRLRYADFGLWTGDTLPEPATCPTFSGFQICGGHCGGCDEGVCIGRSPLHPYGFCAYDTGSGCPATACASDQSCFHYIVQAAAQDLADQEGLCLPKALCEALAADYPGGANCD
jgi:hypothetical protein